MRTHADAAAHRSHHEKFELPFEFEVAGRTAKFTQGFAWESVDHVGLTVWDAALVLAKVALFLFLFFFFSLVSFASPLNPLPLLPRRSMSNIGAPRILRSCEIDQ